MYRKTIVDPIDRVSGKIMFLAFLTTLAQIACYLAVAYAVYQGALWIGRN